MKLFAIFGDPEAVHKTYLGLHSLQHRGQESAGIASSDGKYIKCFTGMGQVARVFRSGRGFLLSFLRRSVIINFMDFDRARPPDDAQNIQAAQSSLS